jgi:hypothetical protein
MQTYVASSSLSRRLSVLPGEDVLPNIHELAASGRRLMSRYWISSHERQKRRRDWYLSDVLCDFEQSQHTMERELVRQLYFLIIAVATYTSGYEEPALAPNPSEYPALRLLIALDNK